MIRTVYVYVLVDRDTSKVWSVCSSQEAADDDREQLSRNWGATAKMALVISRHVVHGPEDGLAPVDELEAKGFLWETS